MPKNAMNDFRVGKDLKPRALLHIGQGKTGSTSIQNALRLNGEVLARHDVFYPESGKHTNHQDIFTYLTGDVKHHDPRHKGARADARKIGLGKRHWQEALREIDRRQPELVVLSCENQFRPFAPEALQRLTEMIAPVFSEVEVVAYLRDPASYFLSMAQQDVKKRARLFNPSTTGFRDVLEPWLTYGPGRVSALRFLKADLYEGDVVADFCHRFLPFAASDLPGTEVPANESMSAEAMDILQAYHIGEIDAPSRHHGKRPQPVRRCWPRSGASKTSARWTKRAAPPF
jgi:hypothetical protein